MLINLRQEFSDVDKKCVLVTWEEIHPVANEFLSEKAWKSGEGCVSERAYVRL